MEFRPWFVRGGRRFLCTYSAKYSTVQFCYTGAVNKYARRTTGTRRDTMETIRELIHGHFKAAHWGAKNTHLLLRSKHIAPKPRIARAPELVLSESWFELSTSHYKPPTSTLQGINHAPQAK